MRLRIYVAVVLLAPFSCVASEDLFDIRPVAQGVFAAIARPAYRVNSNAAIIILGESVLVVDAESTPSAARALIHQIKKLTPKPVQYLVITHLHSDHSQGAEAYVRAWPGVEIVSTDATRANIEQRGIPRWKHEIGAMPQEIEQLKTDREHAVGVEQKSAIQEKIVAAEAYLAELKTIHITVPTLTFDRRLILRRGARTVELLWLGRAHTDGDVFVFLPAEKVLVSGDALHGWTPTMRDSFPYEWIKTLDAAEQLDFEYIVPGHGEVIRGKEQFHLWKQFFHDLLDRTAAAYADGATMEEAKKLVPELLAPIYADKMDHFSRNVAGDVAKAYQVVNPSR